jgi:toxin ParE1/3/4
MPRFTRTRQAEEDLIDIWTLIAEDDPAAADRLLDRIDEVCGHLAENPQLGPARPDLRPELRYMIVARYLVLYRIAPESVEIVSVVHGARDLASLFRDA